MASAASVFHRVRAGSKLGAQYDQEGNLIQVETREDEEQTVKLSEILELLLAAGYFRARIKGLSPFDKVVGGMTWCITTCNFDIDVDLLFQENSTIGQKIALTEKIVSVLPKMKCPHRLEPHQIQGLDFIHIFPVIQWLVKRAIETREEMGDYVRSYSVSQFQKNHSLPEDEEFFQRKDKAAGAVLDVQDVYKPQRKYRRQRDAEQLQDEESRVHSTLLEYGRRYGFSKQSKQDKVDSPCITALIYIYRTTSSEVKDGFEAELVMNVLDVQGKLTASAVGHIVGLQSEEIKQIASEYAEKQSELSLEERSERYGPLQQHRRTVTSLNKHLQQKTKQLEEVSSALWSGATEQSEKLHQELNSLEEMEQQVDSGLLEKLRSLVTMNENLKQQEQEFRTHCREELSRLQQNIEELKSTSGQGTQDERARRNREIAILQRKIDEVPSRAELTQYQKRFIELYSQGGWVCVCVCVRVTLLNSIHDNFQQAMSSAAAKEQFLRQMEQIVEGIKQSRIKMEKKKQENKMRRDQLNDEYLELLDERRLYFKTVKDFKEVNRCSCLYFSSSAD
uniref:Coiled-coil domain-containing protein 93 n=1 Tax=Nothobranchius furzeri TaxID=105023 RepID=A0A8C6MJF3_NOTFU